MNQSPFTPPEISYPLPDDKGNKEQMPQSETLISVSLMMLKRNFVHTGPKVFKAHMDLCGISRSLLLPVAQPEGDIKEQMQSMARMFGSDNCFALATSVPNDLPVGEIETFIEKMITRYHIKAVKLHPNITGINLDTKEGMSKVESILWACRESRVPLIMHGGCSRLLKNPHATSFASIDNFKHINWTTNKAPVIIAHAGLHSCDLTQIETDTLPKIKKILHTHDNVMVDISGLGVKELILVFRNIETDKIFFGSDALYNSQWASVVKAMFAMSKAKLNVETTFSQVASVNPLKHIFKED